MADESSGFRDSFLVGSVAEIENVARRIAPRLRKGDTVALEGDLGAGKTTLVRAILRCLGIEDEVPSPSFTLVQEYEANGLRIAHCDLFRIESPAELDELGMDEAFWEGVAFIEWPQHAWVRIPQDALNIHIEIAGETARRITLSGPARWAILSTDRT